jgi:hypothetical protein
VKLHLHRRWHQDVKANIPKNKKYEKIIGYLRSTLYFLNFVQSVPIIVIILIGSHTLHVRKSCAAEGWHQTEVTMANVLKALGSTAESN